MNEERPGRPRRTRPLTAKGHRPAANGRSAPAGQASVEAVEATAAQLLGAARRDLGVGRAEPVARFAEAVRASDAGWFLMCALAVFVAANQILTSLLSALGPEIRSALGLSDSAYGMIVSQRANAAIAVSLQLAAYVHRRPGRRFLAWYTAFATGAGAVLAGLSHSFWPLFLAVVVTCPTTGAVWALHRPMVMDGYVPEARVRAMSVLQAGIVAGNVAAPAIVWLLADVFGLSWRGVFLSVGTAAVASSVLGLRLRRPRPGRHDTDAVRAGVRATLGSTAGDPAEGVALGFMETLRHLWLVPTIRKLLAAWAVLGVVVTPLLTYIGFFLADRWRMSIGGRSAFIGGAWAFALPALAWFAPRADALFRADPARLVSATAGVLALLAAALVVAVNVPAVSLALVAFGAALAASAVLVPALIVATLAVVRPEARGHAGALVATFLVGVGGQGGAALLGGFDSRFGPGTAIAFLAVPALVAALLVRRAAGSVNQDLDQLLGAVIEEEEIRSLTASGVRLPMLACRHVDFSYGQLQVLFDVNFTIDDGEIVALLGTNGAGKSTLLRVISGLGFPSRGSVRLRGGDITFVDAERRVGMGISQVPGGRAVFGPMTVAENLRALGYSQGRNRGAIESGIEASFAAFPRLAERRDQLASTLSGGEQQMLGLATAFIVRPRLLLIDELSLGLAPIVVGELLEMVRQVNANGTAVVLVEQSVNVALSLVEHAYFMEKGEIRFDGRAADLLARPDLLRSVFLAGATKSLGGPGGSRP